MGYPHHDHDHHYQRRKEKKEMQMPLFFLLILSFSCCHLLPAVSAAKLLLPNLVDEEGTDASTHLQTYIVHVQKPKGMVFARPEDREAWHRSFLPPGDAMHRSGHPRMVFSYDKASSGFAARLSPAEVAAMEGTEGFLSAYPDEPLVPSTTYTPSFLGLDKANGLWNATRMGEGVVVGVVDTGINPFHASFDDAGMPPPPKRWRGLCDFNNGKPACNNKLVGARNFDSTASARLPFDTAGHGTHVASTVAGGLVPGANVNGYAAGRAAGVAPRAHLAVYKANYSSELLAAIDQAIHDRVDVLSISMGLPSTRRFFHQDGIAIGSLAAAEHGVLVSCAAGNDGPSPVTLHNDAPWVLTVGASTTDRAFRVSVRLANGRLLHGESLDRPGRFPVQTLPLVFPGDGGDPLAWACVDRSMAGADVVGKVVLCMGDEAVPAHVAGEVVANAGAAAMLLANSALRGRTLMVAPNYVPTVAITHSDAMEVISYLRSWPAPAAGFRPMGTVYGGAAHPFPAVAHFSSRGPSAVNGGVVKPDLLAPGVNILGASLSGSDFVVMSGTSMATPHVSGVAALLKSLHPRWSPAAIKSAMMTTADTHDSEGGEITDERGGGAGAGLFATGAGHVNPLRAADPGLVYDQRPSDYVRYLCGAGYGDAEVSIVARRAVACAGLAWISGEQLNYPAIAVAMGSAWTRTVTRTVTNVGPAKSMYTAEVDFPLGVAVAVTPAALGFTRANQKLGFNVSFAVVGPFSPGATFQGRLRWVSSRHVVKSPLFVAVV